MKLCDLFLLVVVNLNRMRGQVMMTMMGVVAVTPYEQFSGQSVLKYNRLEGFGSIYGIDPLVLPDMNFDLSQGGATLGAGSIIIGSGVGSGFSEPSDSESGQSGSPLGEPRMMFGMGMQQSDTESTTESIDLYGKTIQLELTRMTEDGQENRTVRLRWPPPEVTKITTSTCR